MVGDAGLEAYVDFLVGEDSACPLVGRAEFWWPGPCYRGYLEVAMGSRSLKVVCLLTHGTMFSPFQLFFLCPSTVAYRLLGEARSWCQK